MNMAMIDHRTGRIYCIFSITEDLVMYHPRGVSVTPKGEDILLRVVFTEEKSGDLSIHGMRFSGQTARYKITMEDRRRS